MHLKPSIRLARVTSDKIYLNLHWVCASSWPRIDEMTKPASDASVTISRNIVSNKRLADATDVSRPKNFPGMIMESNSAFSMLLRFLFGGNAPRLQ